MLDEQGQHIVDTLSSETEQSLTVQVTEESTRICYSIPTTTPLTDLAYWAASMLDVQHTLMGIWHQHCTDLNVPTDEFDKYVTRLFNKMQELKKKPQNTEDDDTPPEAKKDREI
jgi:hypothetical protein